MPFVGLDEGLLNDFLEDKVLIPRERQRIDDRSLVGRDGLLITPVQQIADVGYPSDQF
jgi:hypothetical protein